MPVTRSSVENPQPEILLQVGEIALEMGLGLGACVGTEDLDEACLKRLDDWLDAGRAGEMGYLERGRESMGGFRAWKPWGNSALLFALPYPRSGAGFKGGGRVARYALGKDYHHLLGRRLERLGRRLRRKGLVSRFRAVCDAAPVLEREHALLGAIGFRGKNTLVLSPSLGPWTLLGELLVDADWPTWSPPLPSPSCGSCTSCLGACPTGAFPAPWELDPRRCISYLTIESRRPIPRDLRPLLGDWVFGCDRCLEVCPFGSHAEDRSALWGMLPALREWTLEDLLASTRDQFSKAFQGSPLRRAGWSGLLRNACVALGNLGRSGRQLRRAAAEHPEPLVRGHAIWALGRSGDLAALRKLRLAPGEGWLRAELDHALES